MSKVKIEIDADLQDLVPQFVENRKRDLESLQQLVLKKDIEAIAQLAHKIKGAAAGYGFNELSDLASQLEKAAKAKDEAPLENLVQKMKAHFSNIEIQYIAM